MLVAPFVGYMDAVAGQPMDSMFELRRQAVGWFVVHSCLGIDDDAAVEGQPIGAIAIMNLMLAFARLDLVAAVFVLVPLAHQNVVHELDELNRTVAAADLKPMFVAAVAIFAN